MPHGAREHRSCEHALGTSRGPDQPRCTPNACCTSTSSHLVALLLSIGSPGDLVIELALDGEPYMLHTLREREFAPRTRRICIDISTPPSPGQRQHYLPLCLVPAVLAAAAVFYSRSR
ncbi:hypothetical protein C8R43DRAFT_1140273 [Mycena crocata]|nr:hypothetical protein C8R43DRAFT_1140273 [Mycena crocata]